VYNNYSVNTTTGPDTKDAALLTDRIGPPPTGSGGWHFAGAAAGFSAKYHNNPLTFSTRSFPPERIADRLTDARVFILCTLVCVCVWSVVRDVSMCVYGVQAVADQKAHRYNTHWCLCAFSTERVKTPLDLIYYYIDIIVRQAGRERERETERQNVIIKSCPSVDDAEWNSSTVEHNIWRWGIGPILDLLDSVSLQLQFNLYNYPYTRA